MFRNPAELLFQNGLRALGAQSGTFYIPDPYWVGDLRLALCPGVRYREPLFGFVFPETAEKTIAYGKNTPQICRYADSDTEASNSENISHLFGPFHQRESVGATIRCKSTYKDGVHCVMFVNFEDPETRISPSKLHSVESLFKDLRESIPSISRDIINQTPFPIPDLLSILKPFNALPGLLNKNYPSSLESFLTDVLEATISACGLGTGNSFGTIHLHDESSRVLELHTAVGNFDLADRERTVDNIHVDNRNGLVSWVAGRRAALFVQNLKNSRFSKIHIPMCDDAKSELAVPMMAGSELMGVFNIESTAQLDFDFHQAQDVVRLAWYAANQAAIACRMQRDSKTLDKHASTAKSILSICSELPKRSSDKGPLNQVAVLATNLLDAKRCDLWRYDRQKMVFVGLGANYQDIEFDEPPRRNGWSEFVINTNSVVWIDSISSCEKFNVYRWNTDATSWMKLESPDTPKKLNPRILDQEITCELGIPIHLGENAVGVAWVKYADFTSRPNAEQIAIAKGFAGECALVFTWLNHQEESSRLNQVRVIEEMVQAIRHDAPDRFLGTIHDELSNTKNSEITDEKKQKWLECLSLLRVFFWNIGMLLPSGSNKKMRPQKKSVGLRDVLESVDRISVLIIQKPDVEIAFDDSILVDIDPAITKLAVFLLLDNARKYCRTDDDPAILIQFNEGELTIQDSGMGIEAGQLKKIGKVHGSEIRRDPPGRSVSTIGFGTYLAAKLLRMQGLSVKWSSDGNTGTTVTIGGLNGIDSDS